jgi:hypothetical protein
MQQESFSSTPSLIPPQPIPDHANAFSERMNKLLDGQPKDDAAVAHALDGMDEIFDLIAARLYSLASMLVGEGEDSVRLVESAVANTEVSGCHNPVQSRKSSRRALSIVALETIARRDPASLAAPEGFQPAVTCIEDDDLDAAGVSTQELDGILAGPQRGRARKWLASLPTATRIIFALRAVAGFTSPETAALLAAHGGPRSAAWTPDAVREFFRQGLCSLASQLIQATATR